jgi:hypothetical protein
MERDEGMIEVLQDTAEQLWRRVSNGYKG